MIREFRAYSRGAVERLEPCDVPHLIVSIRTPGDPEEARLPIGPATLGVLRLQFHDTDDRMLESRVLATEDPGWVDRYVADCFGACHARQVLSLVEAHPQAERLLVHCDAGLSRSPAVAAALSKILTGDDSDFFRRYTPNMRVYRTILEAHHGDDHHRDQGG